MPVVSVYANGSSASVLSGVTPAKNSRGNAQGWSVGSARRNDHFLQSIHFEQLTGEPWAITFTIPSADAGKGDLPDSHEFHNMLQAVLKRVKALGAVRWHWVIEMTSKKTPHIHMSVWLAESSKEFELKLRQSWGRIALRHGLLVSQRAQCVKKMSSSGWAQYCSKHGARGVKHYQREREALPEGWRDRPGRMWGYGGDWPSPAERLPERRELGKRAFWRYRRLVRAWCLANARKTKNEKLRKKYICQAKRMLRVNLQSLGEVKPINVWIPETVTRSFLQILEAEYETKLVEFGGDLDAASDWQVLEYVSLSSKVQAHERSEFAEGFRAALTA